MDTYGSTEIGTIAHSCGTCGGFHLLDGLFAEAAPAGLAGDDELVDAEPDAVVLAVSSIKRTSFPVVRFVTYDVVRALRRTVCGGSRRFTFDRVLGRCDDVINYGELFSTHDLGNLIGSRLPAARWLVFNPRNDLTIVVEGAEPTGFREDLRNRYQLHSRMSDLGLLDPPEIHFVDDFDRFAARAGLPTNPHGKAARRVLRRAPEPSWFQEPAR
jgi:cysteine synthase A/phenylacetate-CoA ligase